jgi:hypothetical protein
MIPRPDQHDETVHDAMRRATHHWMRFFAPLRMTAAWQVVPALRFALDHFAIALQSQKRRQSRRTPEWLGRGSNEERSAIRPRAGCARFAPNLRRTEAFTSF